MNGEGEPIDAGDTRLSRAAWTALAVLVVGLVARFLIAHSYSLYDDAYIYLRYAENFAQGCGLVFRCDNSPRVEAFTSPLYMALLLAARAFSDDLETFTQLTGLVALSAAIVLSARTAFELARVVQGARSLAWACAIGVALSLAVDDFVLLNSVTGLETALAMATVAWLFWASLEPGRGLRTAFVLAVLSRPECAVLLPVTLARPEARNLRFWVAPALVLATLAGGRLAYYGELLPNTFYAKSGGTHRHFELGIEYISEFFALFPLTALALLTLLDPKLRAATAPLLTGAAIWLLSFLRTGGDCFAYGRLAAPLIGVLASLGAVGVVSLARSAKRPALSLGVLITLLGGTAVSAMRTHRTAEGHGFANVKAWSQVGRFLARAHPNELVATVPIGAISYFSRSPVLDLVGLADRETAKAGRTVPPERLNRDWLGHERNHLEGAIAAKPSLIVLGRKHSTRPVADIQQLRAGFYAEWLLLQEAKQGRIPYVVYTPEVAPGLYWHMLRRVPR